MRNLSSVYVATMKYYKAIDICNKALQINPDDIVIL